MKRILVVLILCLLAPVAAMAATETKSFTFGWTYLAEWEEDITGFEIYQLVGVQPEKAVISNIPKTARFATGSITYDNFGKNRFYIRAIDASDPLNIDRSDPSNTVKIIISPGQFKKN